MSIGIFLGLTTVDMVFGVGQYPHEDTKTTALQYVTAAGGPATNAAVVFARLGGQARLFSSIGNGTLAQVAVADLQTQGVLHHDLVTEPAADPTISAIAVSQDNGSRTVFTSPAINATAAFSANVPSLISSLVEANILLIDGHQTELAMEAAGTARRHGIPVVLDGDLYQNGTKDLLALVDVAIFGKSFEVPGCATVDATIREIQGLGVPHVVATRGDEPIIFVSEGKNGSVPVASVAAVDTLAAGDFFHGAFCYSYCQNHDIEHALRFASNVATQSVKAWGPRKWLASL